MRGEEREYNGEKKKQKQMKWKRKEKMETVHRKQRSRQKIGGGTERKEWRDIGG